MLDLDFHGGHHALHFLVVGSRGIGWQEATLRDTVNLPAWDGFRQYPSVTVRMDFRDPQIVGTFPFHCHIAQHSDGGMMGTLRVEPPQKNSYSALPLSDLLSLLSLDNLTRCSIVLA